MTRPYADHSKEQLLKLKDENKNVGMVVAEINAELRQREIEDYIKSMQSDIQKLTEPHWTLVPIFRITLASLLIALLAYFRPQQASVQDARHAVMSSPTTTALESSRPTLKMKRARSRHKPVQAKP